MGEFDRVRTKGIALIKRKGRPATLLTPVDAAPVDADKPWRVGAGTTTEIDCQAVVYDGDSADGPAEKVGILPGDIGVRPDTRMRLQLYEADGTTPSYQYAILGTKEYDPDGTPIGFKLRMKLWPSTLSQPQTNFSVV